MQEEQEAEDDSSFLQLVDTTQGLSTSNNHTLPILDTTRFNSRGPRLQDRSSETHKDFIRRMKRLKHASEHKRMQSLERV